ncbi:MAG: reverse transcriptase [Peptoclostridium sp.]|uniref:RNA-directed DNA polymerase n=1 Tax=Peptoclostridium sp. TaxID=1904860 RepID=UPI00139E6CE8|nr:RNA-directed DNA polymerase [Peptoclostridium sp.]MZQ75273.1 reverse transcriptase [Peptoclostridium sp.]
MKRTGYLFEKIVDINNIKTAIINASKKKKKRTCVKKVLANIEFHAKEIQDMLQDDSYLPSPYYVESIIDNSSCKQRVIFKPKFYPDQIIHWATMQVLEPVLMRGMSRYCCGSIPGRGGAHGQKALKKWLRRDRKHTKYTLQLDISKFYPSIDQEILKTQLRRKIKDGRCLQLLDKIIESTSSGLPIGNFTSQWLANFYLEGLDHFIKEKLKIKYAIRYMDDIVMFGSNKKKLHKARKLIAEYLETLKLRLKCNYQVFKTDSRPLDFLGFRFYRDHITLRRRNALRIRRRAIRIKKKGYFNLKDSAAMLSYLGWIYHSDSHKYFKKCIEPNINIEKMKDVIRRESRKQCNASSVCN